MQLIDQLVPLRKAISTLRESGRIAMVPTMGALHEGHMALVREAKQRAEYVVVSIFVNPLQFGAGEDLDAYPRQMAADCAMLAAAGVALVWAPPEVVMYPQGFASAIRVGGVSEGQCGAARPGHFDGVATVVCKLFNQVQPDLALFGEKDWQQLAVIRQMARDLDLTCPAAENIIGVATVREPDGLALSSRNAYLTAVERSQAACLPKAMRVAIAKMLANQGVAEVLRELRATLTGGGFHTVDYADVCDADSLAPIDVLGRNPARLLVAARIGRTRLIDNMPVV